MSCGNKQLAAIILESTENAHFITKVILQFAQPTTITSNRRTAYKICYEMIACKNEQLSFWWDLMFQFQLDLPRLVVVGMVGHRTLRLLVPCVTDYE